ncbi:DHH family phosphoesterase [Bacillus sp. FJAT-45350]|uniref:DHH family phosphoesterase n=1 Tax=Bacillus sp. FJAT-45350 TaxID=2011014 RepID=UPI000BB905D9|nr:bifunctional oligoribonuclease/PAP phosphatase NrnA [Bacillus sp. FJAT-45350]
MLHEIIEKIEKYEKIIIHRHERPDPDALGSQGGLAEIIQYNYPSKTVYVVGEEEPSLLYLNQMDTIEDKEFEGALIIVSDTANTERVSDQRYSKGAFLIKVDHHPNEEPYGDIVWVDTTFSSASEMIIELYKAGQEKGWKLNEKAAFLLYAGIVGDTGRFRFPNTTGQTHRYVSELVDMGIDQSAFYTELYKRDLKMKRLEGYVLQNFEVVGGIIGVMNLSKEKLAEFNVSTSESSQLVGCFSDVEGLKAWVFFVEDEDGEIRVRLRSKGPVINKIAQKYHGGGHPMASGAKAFSWEETKDIIADLRRVCKE